MTVGPVPTAHTSPDDGSDAIPNSLLGVGEVTDVHRTPSQCISKALTTLSPTAQTSLLARAAAWRARSLTVAAGMSARVHWEPSKWSPKPWAGAPEGRL